MFNIERMFSKCLLSHIIDQLISTQTAKAK